MRYFDQFLAAAAIAAYAFAVMGPAGAVTGAAKGAGEVGKGVTGGDG